jgi:hypothetical protein
VIHPNHPVSGLQQVYDDISIAQLPVYFTPVVTMRYKMPGRALCFTAIILRSHGFGNALTVADLSLQYPTSSRAMKDFAQEAEGKKE